MKRKSLVFLLLMAVGCATMPTEEEVENAYYGPEPSSNDFVLDLIKEYSEFRLKDAPSSRFYLTPIGKEGWLNDQFGWLYDARINDKNSFGGYDGWKEFRFLIRDGRVVAAARHREGVIVPTFGNLSGSESAPF